MEFQRPRALEEAVSLGTEFGFDAKYLAGGTAVALMLEQGLIAPRVLIDLRWLEDVDGWSEITRTDTVIRIGANVCLTDVASSPVVRELLPDLATAASVVGNVRVRNMATLCGNAAEADHSSDPPSVLVNRDAVVEIAGPEGLRRQPLDGFFLDFFTTVLEDGEIITALEVPVAPGLVGRYDKFRSRSTEDRPCVSVAAAMQLTQGTVDDLRVTVGANTAAPVRLDDVAGTAVGRSFDEALAAEIAAAYAARIEPMSDARGSAWYRSQVIEVEVRRSLMRLHHDAGGRS